jgi:hypothetical protein
VETEENLMAKILTAREGIENSEGSLSVFFPYKVTCIIYEGKTDSNRNGGENFLSTFTFGSCRILYDKNVDCFLIY